MGNPVITAVPARARLMNGMATAVVEKGYAATTIADIVRHAQVSKRTFYEHFADKQECFLASFTAASEFLLRLVHEATESDAPWPARYPAAISAYLSALQSHPAMTRTLLLELPAAGPRAVALRRRQLQRFADLLCENSARAAREHPGMRALTPELSTAIVGGINELVLLAVEEGRAAQVTDLTETATEMLRAVLTAAPPGP